MRVFYNAPAPYAIAGVQTTSDVIKQDRFMFGLNEMCIRVLNLVSAGVWFEFPIPIRWQASQLNL